MATIFIKNSFKKVVIVFLAISCGLLTFFYPSWHEFAQAQGYNVTFRYPVDFEPSTTNGWSTYVHGHGSLNLDTRTIRKLATEEAKKDPYRPHNGEDWNKKNDNGEQIFAIADGVVVDKSYRSGFGNWVIIRHTAPIGKYFITSSGELLIEVYSLYAHQLGVGDKRYDPTMQMTQNIGDKIIKGDPIGQVGYSGLGKVSIAHLHFEILRKNPLTMTNVNPYNWHLADRVHPTEFIANNRSRNVIGLSDVPIGTDIIVHAYGDGDLRWNTQSPLYPVFTLDNQVPYRGVTPDEDETDKKIVEKWLNPCSDLYPHGNGNWRRDGCEEHVDENYNGELFRIEAGTDGTANWYPLLPRDGRYELSIFVPKAKEYSGLARYVLFDARSSGVISVTDIDQSNYVGTVEDRGVWVTIGEADLRAGHGLYLGLTQTLDHGKKTEYVGADAVRFRYMGPISN